MSLPILIFINLDRLNQNEEAPKMNHTYEVLVDIKECFESTADKYRSGTTRYEIDAQSRETADNMARRQARTDHPQGIEYDVRVTRLLR